MARFTLTRLDELGFPYPVWESDDIDEARDQLGSLMGFLDEAIQPRSGQLEEMISDLKGQIDEAKAEAEESEATMKAIADLVFPPAPWQKA
jgi:hypothetical protein